MILKYFRLKVNYKKNSVLQSFILIPKLAALAAI